MIAGIRKANILWRIASVFTLVTVMLLGLAGSVQAAEFNEDGIIGIDEVIDDDLFIFAQEVVIDGTVNGILFAGGDTVTINGVVNGDVFAVGSEVVVSDTAKIDGNVILGGQNVRFLGQTSGSLFGGTTSMVIGEDAWIERNLYFGGYHIETRKGSMVQKDIFVGSYQFLFNGEAGRDLRVGAEAIEINGKVGRDVIAEVGSPQDDVQSMEPFFAWWGIDVPESLAPGIRVSETSEINGSLTYKSTVEQLDAIISKPEGGIVYQTPVPLEGEQDPSSVHVAEVEQASGTVFLNTLWNAVRNLVTLLLLGALTLWIAPVHFRKTVDQVAQNPFLSLGWGFITITVGYLGIFLSAVVIFLLGLLFGLISLGGLSSLIFGIGFSGLGLISSIFSMLVFYISKVIVAFLVGEWLVKKLFPGVSNPRVWAMVIGVLIFVILRAIPVLGWLAALVAILIGVGAIWLYFRTFRAPSDPLAVEDISPEIGELPAAYH